MKKSLIVYFSYTGNTREIANRMHQKIGGDILEIKTVTPYSSNYDLVVEQGDAEVKANFMPNIKEINKEIAAYDTILLGTPVWWYTFAPAIHTFLSEHSLADKTVIPFMTNGGWKGHILKDIESCCPDAKIEFPIYIQFSEDTLQTPEQEIEDWIQKINRYIQT